MKLLWGAVLLPFCWAATRTLAYLLKSIQPMSYSHLPLSVWGLVIGFVLWVVLYLCLPRPMRTYVLAHELTHALWGWVMGARVSKLRVGKSGGSVSLSKDNFLVTLAPYFFPLYTVMVILGYGLVTLFVDLHTYEPFWLGLVGLTWGFHLTFTISTLLTHQPDIKAYGRLFSYSLIYLFNVLGICLWIVGVASPTLQAFVGRLGQDIGLAWTATWRAAVQVAAGAADFSNHWKR